MQGNEPSHSQGNSHFGSWSPGGFLNFQRAIVGVKTHWIEAFLSLKVKNQPNFHVCRWRATYHWKVFNEDYNFALDIISIGGLQRKLWTPKVTGVPSSRISGLPLGNFGTKNHLDVAFMERHKIYYKGEGGGSPQVWAVVSLVSPSLPVARPSTKSAPTMH